MKTSVLLFFSGLALGVGGTLLQRTLSESSAPAAAPQEAVETVTTRPRWEPSPERKARWAKRHRFHRGGSDDPRADLSELMSQISSINDESELNITQLIRKTAWLTRLSETEAVDLLNFLAEPPESDDDRIDAELRDIAAVVVFARLCELNGPEAMRLAAEEGLMTESKAFAIGMNSWVAADPDGAKQWFEGMLGEADERLVQKDQDTDPGRLMALMDNDEFRKAYVNGMARHDAEGIEKRISRFETEQIRHIMREDLMGSLVEREDSPDGLLRILDKSSDLGEARNEAVAKLAAIDADRAAEWVTTQAPSATRDRDVTAVGMELMQANPDVGAAWFMDQEMTDSEMAKSRMSRIVYRFADEGLPKAEDWVNRQPDCPTRDYAEVAIARLHAQQGDWPATFRWLSDVSDPTTRDQQLSEMFKTNWDKTEQQLKPELLVAAQAAGFGSAARSFQPD